MNPETLTLAQQIANARAVMEQAERIVLWRKCNLGTAQNLGEAASSRDHYTAAAQLARLELDIAKANLEDAERAYDALVQGVC